MGTAFIYEKGCCKEKGDNPLSTWEGLYLKDKHFGQALERSFLTES